MERKVSKKAVPRIICIIDEYAELVLISDKKLASEITDLVTRATNIGRAVGINIVICTQRPAASLVPNSIKGNMPLVIGGRTQNADQSRVIVGDGALADISIDPPGRMLIVSGVDRGEVRAPYVEDADVIEAVRIAKGRAARVVELAGHEPVVIPDGLTRWILENAGGWLTGKTGTAVREMAISHTLFSTYCQNMAENGHAIKVGKSWRLKAAIESADIAADTVSVVSQVPEPVESWESFVEKLKSEEL